MYVETRISNEPGLDLLMESSFQYFCNGSMLIKQ